MIELERALNVPDENRTSPEVRAKIIQFEATLATYNATGRSSRMREHVGELITPPILEGFGSFAINLDGNHEATTEAKKSLDYSALQALLGEFSDIVASVAKKQMLAKFGFIQEDLEGLDDQTIAKMFLQQMPRLKTTYSEKPSTIGALFRTEWLGLSGMTPLEAIRAGEFEKVSGEFSSWEEGTAS